MKHTLLYFGIGGRGEPIRLAFAIGGVPFTNKVMGFPAFKEAKAAGSLPMGQLPVLDLEDGDNKKSIPQSNAILRYVGKLADLYPSSDPVLAMEVDVVIDAVEDAGNYLSMTIKNAPGMGISDEPWPKEQVLKIREKLMGADGKMTTYLKIFEDLLVKNKSGWFVGDKPTIADLKAHHLVGWLTSGILDGIPTTCLDGYPMLKALHGKVEALPQVEAFRAKHGTKYTDFDYTP